MSADFEIEEIHPADALESVEAEDIVKVEQPEAQVKTQAKLSLSKLKEMTDSLPNKVEDAIDSGKANEAISVLQTIVRSSIGAIFSSCQILSMQQLLLSDSGKTALTKRAYIISGVIMICMVILGIILSDFSSFFLALESIVAAFSFDRILNLKHGQNHKKKHKNNNDDNDYL